MTKTQLVCIAALLATPACFVQPPELEAGPEGPNAPQQPQTPVEYELSDDGHAITSTVGQSFTILSGMFEPMESAGESSCEQAGDDGACVGQGEDDKLENEMKSSLETAYGQSCSTVELIDLAWTRIAVKATFDQCQLPSGGPVDGVITVGGELNPVHVWVDFETFTLEDDMADGTADITFQDDGLGGVQTIITSDILLSVDDGAATLDLDGAQLIADQTGATLDGSLAVRNTTVDAEVAASALHWNASECLPSSGDITFDDQGQQVEAEFLSTTPADGKVLVSFDGGPQIPVAVFQPCS